MKIVEKSREIKREKKERDEKLDILFMPFYHNLVRVCSLVIEKYVAL